jgi:hypothetical protein
MGFEVLKPGLSNAFLNLLPFFCCFGVKLSPYINALFPSIFYIF